MNDHEYCLNHFDVLFYIFVVLKLAGLVHWSWWFVVSPWLIPLAIWVAFSIWERLEDL